jgi:hypothetical protein
LYLAVIGGDDACSCSAGRVGMFECKFHRPQRYGLF